MNIYGKSVTSCYGGIYSSSAPIQYRINGGPWLNTPDNVSSSRQINNEVSPYYKLVAVLQIPKGAKLEIQMGIGIQWGVGYYTSYGVVENSKTRCGKQPVTYNISQSTSIYVNLNSQFYCPQNYQISENNENILLRFSCCGTSFVPCSTGPRTWNFTRTDYYTGISSVVYNESPGIYDGKPYYEISNQSYTSVDSYVWYNTVTTEWNNTQSLGSGILYSSLASESTDEPISGPYNQWQTYSFGTSVVTASEPQYPIIVDELITWLDSGIQTSWSGSGFVWYDITINNNNGTYYQSSSATTPNYLVANGGSFSFNGSNQKFSIPNSETLSAITNTVSVEVWLRPTLFDDREIFCQGSNFGYRMRLDTTGHLWMLGANTTTPTNYNIYVSTGTTTLNQWNQVVGVWTPTGFYTYINGINSGYDTSASLSVQLSGTILDIGCFTGNNPDFHYEGDISVFRIYNKELTPDEVLSNFNSQKDRFGL